MNIKNILLIAGIAGTGAYLYGKTKIEEFSSFLDRITFELKSINGIDFSDNKLSFKTDVIVVNPTSTSIDVSGNLLTIEKLNFYTKTGRLIGIATPNVNVSMPAKGHRVIKNIPVLLDLKEMTSDFNELFKIVGSPKENLIVSAKISAFGQSVTI